MRTEYNNYASQALEKAAQDAASCHQKYIGTRQEDHIYDECRYVLMENPISPPVRCAAPPMPDDPLNLHKRARFYRI